MKQAKRKAKAGQSVDSYVAKLKSPQRETVQALRTFIRENSPELKEQIKWGNPCYTLKGNVCWILAYGDHTDFGFFRGTSLDDPRGLLEGTGKGLRHVKIWKPEDVRPDNLVPLLRQAVALDKA